MKAFNNNVAITIAIFAMATLHQTHLVQSFSATSLRQTRVNLKLAVTMESKWTMMPDEPAPEVRHINCYPS